MTVPNLGPICRDDKSVLDFACTHWTTGLQWPAFDAGWVVGRDVLAPEGLNVYDNTSSSQGGDAFYCQGDSGIRYWVAHIQKVPRQNARFGKGQKMTEISGDHPRPHVHLAVDARRVLGGAHLVTGQGYALGAPTIRAQFDAANAASPPPPDKEDPVYEWLDEWLEWQIQGQHREPPMPRPPAAPATIPDDAWVVQKQVVAMLKRQGADPCWQKWMAWKDAGEAGARPDCAPDKVYEEWWEARERE